MANGPEPSKYGPELSVTINRYDGYGPFDSRFG